MALMNSSDGVNIGEDSKRNKIMGNFIGNNSRDGIRIRGSQAMYNTISENSISMNDGQGINLLDSANAGISAPVFTEVIENFVFGSASPHAIIEIFTDSHDEGRIIQGVVLADSAGNFGWEGTLTGPFDSIRATATDTLGNTSEFGLYRPEDEPTSMRSMNDPISFNLIGNGYRPEIQVAFDLPATMDLRLEVFNLGGQKVAGIYKGRLQAGFHSITWNTSAHAAGIYLVRMQTRRGALTRKCMVLK
jgi:parallel beta-helix repeat protein